MARRPEIDQRQADFFGPPAAAPVSATPDPRRRSEPSPKQDLKRRSPSSDGEDAPVRDSIDELAARLSPVELTALVAALSDAALAHLVIATARQLRRRLARNGGRGSKGHSPVLERSALQLSDELGGQREDSDGWYGD